MVTQLTIRDVPEEDVERLRREAAVKRVSLNSLLRDVITAEAALLRRRKVMKQTHEMDRLRAKVAEESGGYLTDSTDLIREERDQR